MAAIHLFRYSINKVQKSLNCNIIVGFIFTYIYTFIFTYEITDCCGENSIYGNNNIYWEKTKSQHDNT